MNRRQIGDDLKKLNEHKTIFVYWIKKEMNNVFDR